MLVQSENSVDLIAMKIFEEVNFVKDGVFRAEVLRGRMVRVHVDTIDASLGMMCEEFAAEHLDIGRITVKSVAGGMGANERFARLDPFDEGVAIRERQVARGVGEDDTVVIL